MSSEYKFLGANDAAAFTLAAWRGDGMVLLAMNWRDGVPPDDFVGFSISCTSPGSGHQPQALTNLLTFPAGVSPNASPASSNSPFQRFRWVHFPEHYYADGTFTYEVTAMHMAEDNALTPGETQTVELVLGGETYPGELDVSYTRGFIGSQAYVRHFKDQTNILPAAADNPLTFESQHPEALAWMGFGARYAMFEVLEAAKNDATATIDVIAYDLDEAEFVNQLVGFGPRLRIIIDNSDDHVGPKHPEDAAAATLEASAGADHVVRQHLGNLQHNKVIVVRSATTQLAVCGSTNFSWRGLYVQNNNVIVLRTEAAVQPFAQAFDDYFGSASKFRKTPESLGWLPLGLPSIDAKVTFSPHTNPILADVAADIASATKSVFYSLAFLYQDSAHAALMEAIDKVTNDDNIFVYGISDQKVGGLVLHKDAANPVPVSPASLNGPNTPYPFSVEPTLSGGIQMHHKFVVIDAGTPDARVYVGSFNFSNSADVSNGENLMLIRDGKVASSFLVEALSMFDHYSYRLKNEDAPLPGEDGPLPATLQTPPRAPGAKPWFADYFDDGPKQRDRELFA